MSIRTDPSKTAESGRETSQRRTWRVCDQRGWRHVRVSEGAEKQRHTIIEYRIAEAVDGLIIVNHEANGGRKVVKLMIWMGALYTGSLPTEVLFVLLYFTLESVTRTPI